MKRFRYWRKMTWAMLIAGAFLFVLTATSGFSLPTIALLLGVLAVLSTLWLLTQPPWRQGRGLHLRRPQYVHVPFKRPSSSVSQDIS